MPIPNTNTYHLPPIECDVVTNASEYGFKVYSNGLLVQLVWSDTNHATISNLPPGLDGFAFTAIARNIAGISDDSEPATLRWMSIVGTQAATNIDGPWYDLPTNQFEPVLAHQYFRPALSNWSAASLLRKD